MVEDAYPSHKAILNKKVGGAHVSPHTTTPMFMMKKGAQQITNVEKTTPSTLLAFSSDIVEDFRSGVLGRNGKEDIMEFLESLAVFSYFLSRFSSFGLVCVARLE